MKQSVIKKRAKAKAKAKAPNRWADHYTRKAQKENFPARSVYKLKEIQEKHGLLKKDGRILDLGCAPGSWLIYASQQVGVNGLVVGADLKPIKIQLPENVTAYEADIFDLDDEILTCGGRKFHVVMSDMAPSTTGNKHVDSARSYALSEAALFIAQKALLPGGSFICKIFQGEDFNPFLDLVKSGYKSFKIYKPQSTRKASKEIYVIGLEKKETPAVAEAET
jgi:23S rRNA (uridine2552-2'-O)-methyltransferase